ncbi:hypothetical protein MTR67_007291 [Solanum verrucosum]|uniref:Glabrous enhancer-binding protein-like DBD domain-containing protein n=1 Tax=Solanum verrucosum TaxID=315347 RepID=A0AAF0PZP1_SOLVR|nr:hypothetical protein MTR67_007291 [Solanum verrucosum]
MAENSSTDSGNCSVEFVREEEEIVSKKRKNKDVDVTRFLYNDTPSDGYDEEKTPSPKAKRMMKLKSKPPLFSKVWSDEDEISLLTGIIKFKEQTAREVAQNMAEFRAFILPSLTLQATPVQLREKIRRIRLKYEKTLATGNPSNTDLHQVQVFQLCQKIWTQPPNSNSLLLKENHNIPENDLQVKEKHNIPDNGLQVKEEHNIPENGQPGKQNLLVKEKKHNIRPIQQHKIIPDSGLDGKTMEDLLKRLAKDVELVVNSKACLQGNSNEVGIRVLDIGLESMKLGIKLGKLVHEKATSPELQDSPELREQVVLRAYLEAKIEHAQLLLNAYDGLIKWKFLTATKYYFPVGVIPLLGLEILWVSGICCDEDFKFRIWR